MISGTFYTLGEAAKVLDKDRVTVRRWIQSGRLSCQKIGNLVLIPKDDVDAMLVKS